MPRKGGKIIGLAKDEKGRPSKEVSPTDPIAVMWFDTDTYKTLTKDDAIAKHNAVFGEMTPNRMPTRSVSAPTPAVGLGRRKSRRGKKSRRVTRRR